MVRWGANSFFHSLQTPPSPGVSHPTHRQSSLLTSHPRVGHLWQIISIWFLEFQSCLRGPSNPVTFVRSSGLILSKRPWPWRWTLSCFNLSVLSDRSKRGVVFKNNLRKLLLKKATQAGVKRMITRREKNQFQSSRSSPVWLYCSQRFISPFMNAENETVYLSSLVTRTNLPDSY